jgi:tellurite resistance protein
MATTKKKAKKVVAKARKPAVKKAAAKPVKPTAPPIDLSNPKDHAVLEVLALAMSADSLVTEDETTFAVEQMQRMLGLPKSDRALAEQLRSRVTASVAAIQSEGRQVVLQRAMACFESEDECRMLFALAVSMACIDGALEIGEAQFLAQLRVGLHLTESDALVGVSGVATLLARKK